jgi:hypothetical protein
VAKPFNWGAFLMTWQNLGYLWAFNMRMNLIGGILLALFLLPFVIGIVGWMSFVSAGSPRNGYPSWLNAVTWVFNLARLGFGIYLGINGNKLAWQNRAFTSTEDFHQCQRIWTYWAVGLLIGAIVLVFMGAIMLGAVFMAAIGAAGGGMRR